MAQRADDIIDRRRLRRKLTFWRVAALLVLAVGIGWAAYAYFGDQAGVGADHVARVRIEGTVTVNRELLERLERIAEADRVKGVILTVNSPGGTTTGGEAIYEAVRKLAEKKPVVAQVETLAASAGYMIASATDHIVARQSSIVGSIGVLVQYPDLTGLMDRIGVKMEAVKSSPLKAEPSPFTPTTEEERAMLRALILDSYNWFVDLVAERRDMTRQEALSVADGSIFTGRQAAEMKLVDAIGGEEKAREWLTGRGVSEDLEVIEWRARDRSASFLLAEAVGERLGLGAGLSRNAADLLQAVGADRMFLDGLVSLWQPAGPASGR